MMKHPMFAISLRKTVLMAVLVLLAMGACKSKKKAVEPAPVQETVAEVAKPTPAPAPVVRSADEIAVEKLESQFSSIASASNAANQSIQEVLAMFSNPETPLLIVIHEEGGVKDYDEPTTIKKYLEYLKDTKKNLNYISDIRLAGGKVTELELKRK